MSASLWRYVRTENNSLTQVSRWEIQIDGLLYRTAKHAYSGAAKSGPPSLHIIVYSPFISHPRTFNMQMEELDTQLIKLLSFLFSMLLYIMGVELGWDGRIQTLRKTKFKTQLKKKPDPIIQQKPGYRSYSRKKLGLDSIRNRNPASIAQYIIFL